MMDTRVPGEYVSLFLNKNWHWGVLTVSPPASTIPSSNQAPTTQIITMEETSTSLVTTPQTYKSTTTRSATTPGLTLFTLFIGLMGLFLVKKSFRG